MPQGPTCARAPAATKCIAHFASATEERSHESAINTLLDNPGINSGSIEKQESTTQDQGNGSNGTSSFEFRQKAVYMGNSKANSKTVENVTQFEFADTKKLHTEELERTRTTKTDPGKKSTATGQKNISGGVNGSSDEIDSAQLAKSESFRQGSALQCDKSSKSKIVQYKSVAPNVASISEQPNFPDFMAGFDKVALSIRPEYSGAQISDEQTLLQCSPPFTSRSFDDFHRLLGSDLTPLDDGASEASPKNADLKGLANKPCTEVEQELRKARIDTTALFTAESYAMFAQESALAASQHAAYLAQSHVKMPQRNQRMGSFDFDSTMKLVSQHVPQHVPLLPTRPSSFPMASSINDKGKVETAFNCTATVKSGQIAKNTPAVVSGSEPASSAAESSLRGSTSESIGSDNTFSNSDDAENESGDEYNSSGDSSFGDATVTRKRKNTRHESFSSGQFDAHDESRTGDFTTKRHKLSEG